MPIKIYSDNTTSAVIVDEVNRSYKHTSLDEARKIKRSIQASTYYKNRLEVFIEELVGRGYERME